MANATLRLETDSFQVFEVMGGLGVVLLSRREMKNDVASDWLKPLRTVKVYDNVFMQGDDATDFLKEVENCVKAKTEDGFVNSWLSEYNTMFEETSLEDLREIGVDPKAKRQQKTKGPR
jgi:hypothetical protein